MANHKSAVKRIRQDIVRKVRNSSRKTRIKTGVKGLLVTIKNGDKTAAEGSLKLMSSTIAKAASKGIMHKKTASRKISRLAKKVTAMAS